MPIDIITGILFLLIAFADKLKKEKEEEIIDNIEETVQYSNPPKSHSRDIIINPKKPKED